MLVFLLPYLLWAQPEAAGSYRMGLDLMERRQADQAVPHLERAVALDPKNARYQKALGVALASLDRIRESVEPFRHACSLEPGLLDACYYYGRSLYSTDQYEGALAPLETALKIDAVKGRAETAIAQCNEALGRDRVAERRFRSALARADASNQQARLAFGRFLVRQGRAAEAVTVLQPAQARETADSRYELGLALSQCDRLDEAAISLERAVVLDPNQASAHGLLAKVYRRLGRAADAAREEAAAAALGSAQE